MIYLEVFINRTRDLLGFSPGANNRSTFTVFDARARRGIDRSHFPTAARLSGVRAAAAAAGRKSPRPLDRKSTRLMSGGPRRFRVATTAGRCVGETITSVSISQYECSLLNPLHLNNAGRILQARAYPR